MPSPLGHALGGIAAAWVAVPRRNWNAALILAATALAPDLDLLVGDHRGISHSLGAAVVAGLIGWIAAAVRQRRQPRLGSLEEATRIGSWSDPSALRWGVAIGLAWASHIAFDWLSNDTRPPIGVMALWPITRDYYKAAIEIFPPVSRRWGDVRFWQHNIYAAAMEVLIMTPLLLLVLRTLKRK